MGCGVSSDSAVPPVPRGDVAEMDEFGKPLAIPLSAVSALEKPLDDDSSNSMETVIESKLNDLPSKDKSYDKGVELTAEEEEQVKAWLAMVKEFDQQADFDAHFDQAMNSAGEVYNAFKALPSKARGMNKVVDATWNISMPMGAAVIGRMGIDVNTPQVEIDKKCLRAQLKDLKGLVLLVLHLYGAVWGLYCRLA